MEGAFVRLTCGRCGAVEEVQVWDLKEHDGGLHPSLFDWNGGETNQVEGWEELPIRCDKCGPVTVIEGDLYERQD